MDFWGLQTCVVEIGLVSHLLKLENKNGMDSQFFKDKSALVSIVSWFIIYENIRLLMNFKTRVVMIDNYGKYRAVVFSTISPKTTSIFPLN